MKTNVRILILTMALAWSVGCSDNPGIDNNNNDQTNSIENSSDNSQAHSGENQTANPQTNTQTNTHTPNNNSGGTKVPTTCEEKWKAGLLPRFGDEDGDDIMNIYDLCPCVDTGEAQDNQADADGDYVGDKCDNCPNAANDDQTNICDSDSSGYVPSPSLDFVTKDSDGDGVPDVQDNCPNHKNPGQGDRDWDGVGDDCDNCPDTPNKHQKRSDKSKPYGDACSPVPAGPSCLGGQSCPTEAPSCKKGVCVCDDQTIQSKRLEPNVVLVIDESGSMQSNQRTEHLLSALNTLADQTYDEVRYGIAIYSTNVGPTKSVRKWSSPYALKQNWSNYNPVDSNLTATWKGIQAVPGLITDSYDPDDHKRYKAAVVLTDGVPYVDNVTTDQKKTVNAVKALTNQGIDTIFIGVQLSSGSVTNLQKAQDAAKVKRNFINAKNPSTLTSALKAAATEGISCIQTISTSIPDQNQIWIYYNGTIQPRSSWSYDKSVGTLTLLGSLCNQVKSGGGNVEVIVGCAGSCKVDPEFKGGTEDPRKLDPNDLPAGKPRTYWCDGIDNNCDGKIDEGCNCVPEICGDKIDNDCDGIVDNGCNLKKIDEDCETDADCFASICDENTKKCVPICRTIGVKCSDSNECCTGLSCGNGLCTGG